MIIWIGMVGRTIATARNAPKFPYCPSGIAFASRCTTHISIPPPMFAIISQPLWRKKEARDCSAEDPAGLDVEFDMRVLEKSG
ncbi:MAG: hypothetical protein NTX27_04065 [Verrucomicrobia bacterium]|nr:hypothetical protein [Verrucomicrobiota bacterium]